MDCVVQAQGISFSGGRGMVVISPSPSDGPCVGRVLTQAEFADLSAPGALSLSAGDGLVVSLSVASVWLAAYALRLILRTLNAGDDLPDSEI